MRRLSVVGLFWVLAAFHGAAAMEAGDFEFERNQEVENAEVLVEEKAPPVADAAPLPPTTPSQHSLWSKLRLLALYTVVFFLAHFMYRLHQSRVVKKPAELVGEVAWDTHYTTALEHGIEGVTLIRIDRYSDKEDEQMEWGIQGLFKREMVVDTKYADGGRAISSEMRTGSRVEKVEKITKDNTVETKRTVTEGSRTLSVRRQAVAGSATTIEATFVDTEGETKEEYNFIVGSDGMLKSSSAVPEDVRRDIARAVEVLDDLLPFLEQKLKLLHATTIEQDSEEQYQLTEEGVVKSVAFVGQYHMLDGGYRERWRLDGGNVIEELEHKLFTDDGTTMSSQHTYPRDSGDSYSMISWKYPDRHQITIIKGYPGGDTTTYMRFANDGSIEVSEETSVIGSEHTTVKKVETSPDGSFVQSPLPAEEKSRLFSEALAVRTRAEALEGRIADMQRTTPNKVYPIMYRQLKAYLQSFAPEGQSDESSGSE